MSHLKKTDVVTAACLAFFFWGAYVFSMNSSLPPYRDAGEMVTVLQTLGVAHPPGYPLYTILGHLFLKIPLGNLAYRASLFSASAAVMCLAIFFLFLRKWLSWGASLVSVCLLGFSHPFWELAIVPEMYALGLAWVVFIFWALFVSENGPLLLLLMGLGLGVRMDLLLIYPILFWALAQKKGWASAFRALPFFFLGLSVILYLMVRSLQNPWLDWGNPDNFGALFSSLRRKSYSGTLDVLSLSYKTGENFLANLGYFLTLTWRSMAGWGLLVTPLGAYACFKKDKSLFGVLMAIFLLTCPFFLFLANLPPNTHALAIVEASFLVPQWALIVFAGFGALWLMERLKIFCHPRGGGDPFCSSSSEKKFQTWMPASAGMTAFFLPLLFLNVYAGYQRASKRDNTLLRDYDLNVLRSTPEHSVAVFQKDVQLFSLWYSQIGEQRRPDVSLISAGLSGSPWYVEMKKRWPTAESPILSFKERGGWIDMRNILGDRPFLVGLETDYNPQGLAPRAHGFELVLNSTAAFSMVNQGFFESIALFRSTARYGETPDFFSTDLLGDEARAHQLKAHELLLEKKYDEAEWFFRRAEALDPTAPMPFAEQAYQHVVLNQLPQAKILYERAIDRHQERLRLIHQFNSLPSAAEGTKRDAAQAYVAYGVVMEKLHDKDASRRAYNEALSLYEDAQAHYNMAVTYWNEDWDQVALHLRRALEINPHMSEARAYWPVVENKLKEKWTGKKP